MLGNAFLRKPCAKECGCPPQPTDDLLAPNKRQGVRQEKDHDDWQADHEQKDGNGEAPEDRFSIGTRKPRVCGKNGDITTDTGGKQFAEYLL